MTLFDPNTEAGADAARRMQTEKVAWLTTVARDGTPQSSIVAFLWDGERITVWSEPGSPKVRNLVENHRCSFTLNSDEHGNRMVTIEGTAHLPPDGPLWTGVPAYVEKYEEVARHHWHLDLADAARRYRQQIVITPRRARAW